MLVRKLQLYDTLIIGETIMQVRRTGSGELRLAIAAPAHIEIVHASEGREVRLELPEAGAEA